MISNSSIKRKGTLKNIADRSHQIINSTKVNGEHGILKKEDNASFASRIIPNHRKYPSLDRLLSL